MQWLLGSRPAKIREAAQQDRHRNPGLQPGQRCPKAVVDAPAEGEVPIRGPMDVQDIGVGEHLRIAIGCCERRDHQRCAPYLLVADDDVFRCPSRSGGFGGRDESQKFLDGIGRDGLVVAEKLGLPRLGQQRHRTDGEQGRGGFVASGKQEQQRRDDLASAQLVALVASQRERRHQIAPSFASPGGDEPAEVAVELQDSCHSAHRMFLNVHQPAGPAGEPRYVMVVDPDQPRHHGERERYGEVCEQVAVCAELSASGIEGLSVERVAQRAGVNKTRVYRRWPTRAALVAAAMEGMLDELGADPDTGDLRGDLTALLRPIADFAATPDGTALLRAAMSPMATRRCGRIGGGAIGGRLGGAGRARCAGSRPR